MAAVIEQTTEAFDWKLIGFIKRGRINWNFSHSKSMVCVHISSQISSLKFVPNGPINNKPALVQIMVCCLFVAKPLTHWGRVTHICVSKLTTIGSDNGLSPGRRQAIIWTNAGILLIRTLGTNFSEILGEIHSFSFSKMHLKMSSAKWRLFGLGLNELTDQSEPMMTLFGDRHHMCLFTPMNAIQWI